MTKVVTAEYDADANALRLEKPLEGVGHREKVTVTIDRPDTEPAAEPSWMKFSGIWSTENGEDVARRLEDMFPPWNADE